MFSPGSKQLINIAIFARLYVIAMCRALIPLLLYAAIRASTRSPRALSMLGPTYTRKIGFSVYTRRNGRPMMHSWSIEAPKTMMVMMNEEFNEHLWLCSEPLWVLNMGSAARPPLPSLYVSTEFTKTVVVPRGRPNDNFQVSHKLLDVQSSQSDYSVTASSQLDPMELFNGHSSDCQTGRSRENSSSSSRCSESRHAFADIRCSGHANTSVE